MNVSPTTQQRLFTPGTGATPPALTGREREQGVLTHCLADLLGGTWPPHDVVLTGPRGTGKTVLINWFERACRDHESDVDVVKLTPADIPTRDALIEVLAPPPGIAKLLPRKLEVAAVGSVEWAPPTGGAEPARGVDRPMPQKAAGGTTRRGAHARPGGGQNAAQRQSTGARRRTVSAGARRHAGVAGASRRHGRVLLEPLGRGRLGIGLLSEAAARAALVEPLAVHGEGIDADALATVVENSQRYPYFIQLWGEALWKRLLATGAARLTAAHAAAAWPDVVARVTDYYEDRYLELDQSGWLAVAERVAERFQSAAGGVDSAASPRIPPMPPGCTTAAASGSG